jgi:hypothetical protein
MESGVLRVTEQKVVVSSPDMLPPHLTGTEHDWQMGGFSRIRSRRSRRKDEQKRRLREVKQAHRQAYHHFLFRYSPNA